MAKVWKIGSRWNEYGDAKASILSIFLRNNTVFVGLSNEGRFLHEVERGDYFAIADGYQIVAVAKAVSAPDYIGNLKEIIVTKRDNCVFNFKENKDWAVGVKVQIHEVKKEDWGKFYYMKRSSFCRVNDELSQKIIEYYEYSAPKFSIASYTSTLISGPQSQYSSLLDRHVTYIVPVYQRPYEWTELQINQFITDIVNSFLGKERNARNPEPMFIGTMQLSEKRDISKTEIQQNIIDGQQRITTLTIFLKELKKLYPQSAKLSSLRFDWLETHVNKEQSKYLESYLNDTEVNTELNVYSRNAKIITNCFLNECGNVEEGTFDFEKRIDLFCDYILHSLYFVVIETTAGLSKTIQIFNTINNTGLDLNGSDLFKVRMYEYLTDYLGEDESAFDKIQEVYQLLDSMNKKHGRWVTGFDGILDIYKNVLVTKYNLNSGFYSFGWDTFFERLFDTLLGVKSWDNFGPVLSNKDFFISLDEIKQVIELRFEYSDYKYVTLEAIFALNHSNWWSRYSRSLWLVIYQFLYFNRGHANRYVLLERLVISLDKLFFIYSVTYYKQIYDINNFVAELIKSMAHKSPEEIIGAVKNKYAAYDQKLLERTLGGYINDNEKRKRLVCSLSTFLEERYDNPEGVIKNIFETSFDIEHIHANADEEVEIDDTLQNSIGNLAQLEYDINRSIQADPFKLKRIRYKDSKYLTFQRIAAKYTKWDTEEAEHRRVQQVEKMLHYIYDE